MIPMLLNDRDSGRQIKAILLGLLSLVTLAGCIVIPIPTGEKPYYAGAIPDLQVGITSKHEALKEFGVPNVSFTEGSELIYIATQESWKLLWAFILVGPAGGGGGGGGVETLHTRYVLSLSFDTNDVLSEFEFDKAGDDFGDCTRHGICFGHNNTDVMRYANSATEAAAKEFKPNEAQCSIYLHGPGHKKAYEVSFDGKILLNMFSTNAFVHWTAKPGSHSLGLFPKAAYLDFGCGAGEIVFVHLDRKRFSPSTLHREDSATGRAHIADRHLVLLPNY
jgi:hypothetical protein